MKYKHIIFIIFCIFFANSSEFTQVNLTEGEYLESFKNLDSAQFKVQKVSEYNYLKVKVEGVNNGLFGNNFDTNHIISYYDNETLVERKQLSQSLTKMTIMWLTKKQIEKDFYLTVECAKTPCDFKLELIGKNSAEIYLDEQYTYYVTNENKEMNFSLFNSKEPQELVSNNEYLVAIWARGNQKIESKLEGGDSKKYSEYNYYRVDNKDFINNKYILTINGAIGDLINIGLILFHKDTDNIFSYVNELENGVEITGFVDYNESQHFKMKDPSSFGYYYDFNNKPVFFSSLMNNYKIRKHILDHDSSFYSFQHLFDTHYIGQGNNIYSPLLDGIYYYEKILQGTIIGLIPMKPGDFNHLTYEVFPFKGEIDVSIYRCENYPLCHLTEDNFKESKGIKDYKSYYYTYNKTEWNNNISPISKEQNMLLIKCKNGIVDEQDETKYICLSNINMKTDKKVVNNTEFSDVFHSHPRFIRQKNEDKYFFKGRQNDSYFCIETLSGNIDIIINPKLEPILKKGNKYLYLIKKTTDITVTIKGSENSVYQIYDSHNDSKLEIGYNYLYNIDKEKQLTPAVYANDGQYNYYIGIHYLDCPVDVEFLRSTLKEQKSLNKVNDSCQDTVDNHLLDYSVNLKNINSKESCHVFISTYKLETLNSKSNGIILGFKNSYSFLFNVLNDYSMLFSLPYTQKEKDVIIDFTLINKNNYTVKFMINDTILKEEKLNSSQKIEFKSDDLNKSCSDSQFICKILLFVKSEDKKDLVLKINPKVFPESDTSNTSNKSKKSLEPKVFIIIGSVAFLLIVIIVVIIICVFKNNSKNKDLAEKVNAISFQTDNKDDEDDEGAETLI